MHAEWPCSQGCGVDGIPGDSDSDSDSDPPESTPTPSPESTTTLYGLNTLQQSRSYNRLHLFLYTLVQICIYVLGCAMALVINYFVSNI